MQLTFGKWGNSLATRYPIELLREMRIKEGDVVDVTVKGDSIILKRTDVYSLDTLLAEVTPENMHNEIPSGGELGAEGID